MLLRTMRCSLPRLLERGARVAVEVSDCFRFRRSLRELVYRAFKALRNNSLRKMDSLRGIQEIIPILLTTKTFVSFPLTGYQGLTLHTYR